MYARLGNFVARWAAFVILFWIVLVAAIGRIAPSWDDVTQDGDLAYLPDRMTSVRGQQLLSAAFPDVVSRSQVAIVLSRDDGPLEPADRRVLLRLQQRFAPAARHDLPIVQVWTPHTEVVGNKLASRDGRAELVLLLLANEFMAVDNIRVLDAVREALAEERARDDFPAGLQLGVTGSAAVGGDMLASARESIQSTEITTVALVLAILLLVYRAPLLAIVPLTSIAVSVIVATHLVALLAELPALPGWEWFHFKIFKTTRIFVVTLLFGAGTDFCLFLIARYKEELQRGLDRATAVARALAGVGDAVVASAATTIVGLSMMALADFGKFRYSGPAIALCLLVALVACLTLTPALLQLLGWSVFWPFSHRVATRPGDTATWGGAIWGRVADAILARPGLILIVSFTLLMPLAYHGLHVPISYNLLAELDSSRPSVVGTELLRRHYAAGETSPLTMLATKPQYQFDSREGKQQINLLTRTLYDLAPDEITSIRSLTEPLGDRPRYQSLLTPRGLELRTAREHPRTSRFYVAQAAPWTGQITRLDVVSIYDPFSPAAANLLERLENRLEELSRDEQSFWHGASFDFIGTTAGTRDLGAVTASDQWTIQASVTLAVLAVLIVILRRPGICLYLIATVIFSYLVTIGATKLLFTTLYPGLDGLDWKVPIFLFVILVAVGQDYNIYLATRVFEEQRRLGARAGLREAIVRTGGIITSCGLIMAGTFVSMTTGTLRGMLELGFALTLGILLDTFVVRTVMAPCFLALLATEPAPGNQPTVLPAQPPRVPDAETVHP